MPHIEVQLATATDSPPKGDDWLYEVKYDGYRIVAYVQDGTAQLITRAGNDLAPRFPTVASALAAWANGRTLIVDGELAAVNASGRTNFQALQGIQNAQSTLPNKGDSADLTGGADGVDSIGNENGTSPAGNEGNTRSTNDEDDTALPDGETGTDSSSNENSTDPAGNAAGTDSTGNKPNTRSTSTDAKIVYLVFDLLFLDGCDLREYPLTTRKRQLKALMTHAPEPLHYSRHIAGDGAECLAAACRMRLEGIVGKRACSPYRKGRNGNWIKLKCIQRQELVIGGFCRGTLARPVRSLLLGVYGEDGHLHYAGRVGSGLDEREASRLADRFRNLEQPSPAFTNPPKVHCGGTENKVVWLIPQLAAEVKFTSWTNDGRLRHPVYLGLRDDKDPRSIYREAPPPAINSKPEATITPPTTPQPSAHTSPRLPHEHSVASPVSPSSHPHTRTEHLMTQQSDTVVAGVRITNPNKLLFEDPPTTKEQVARYYAHIAHRMLPYIDGRILSIVRCPHGAGSSCFFKRHPEPSATGIVPVEVPAADGTAEEYFYIDSTYGLVSEAQMGTLEFHIWGSRADDVEHPDLMVLDLDPDKGLDLAQVRQAARDAREVLDELGLTAFLKTSGGKGYHIALPFEPAPSWEAFSGFAKRLAQVMAEKWPNRYTSNVRLAKRNGKVFVDWMRNGRGATSIAPYSLRARSGARVSMPISWDELDDVAPDGISLTDALERVRGADPWKGFFEAKQALRAM